MSQRIAYYKVMCGLPGCLPNNVYLHSWPTRRDMTQGINEILDQHGFSQRNRRQVDIPWIWEYIQSGRKQGHFVIKGNMGNLFYLEFIQMELKEWRADDAWELC